MSGRRVPIQLLEFVLGDGKTVSLSLAKAHFGPFEIVSNKLKRLSLDLCWASAENLSNVMLGSTSLETLSLRFAFISPSIVQGITLNKDSLKVISLSSAVGWTIQSLQALCQCTGLIELDLSQSYGPDQLDQASVEFLCKKLPEGLEKLSLKELPLSDEALTDLLIRLQLVFVGLGCAFCKS